MVTPWMELGNAHEYVQNEEVDPRPLASQKKHTLYPDTKTVTSVTGNCKRTMLFTQPEHLSWRSSRGKFSTF